ncbi:Phosphate-specific transport system accessory protein PhoU [Phycisphaerales bacterium]|nr:Phosphate-specific transport system accessory protein PhoU [Phycisphaerales bacterium]
MTEPTQNPAPSDHVPAIDRKVTGLKRRLVREATLAVSMLEQAIAALWKLDAEAARAVRLRDDQVDIEEIAIEQECYEVLALRAPYAHDFRMVTFILRANTEVERVADHASSIAKVVQRIAQYAGPTVPAWPTALQELGQRVPALCHETLRAVLDEDMAGARAIVVNDAVIDQLEKRLFDETLELMQGGPHGDADLPIGLLVYRVGRELERVGDLMASIAEDVVYVCSGEIIRHAKRRQAAGG